MHRRGPAECCKNPERRRRKLIRKNRLVEKLVVRLKNRLEKEYPGLCTILQLQSRILFGEECAEIALTKPSRLVGILKEMSYSREVIFHFIRDEIIIEILNLINASKHSLADKLVHLAVAGKDEEYRKIIENLMGEGVSMTTGT